ncbi:MAG: sensor histidine kinase, partial [Myxococcaceae bacterium]
VMNILDEASQVRAYSRQLEQKSRQLEEATRGLRAANKQLQELDRMKDDFVSTVTHELRTPLTSIRAFSEILLDDPEIRLPDRKRFLATIVKETQRLTRLINQVLELAKIESGSAEWHTTELNVKDVIRESVETTSQLFRENRIELEMAVNGELFPAVRADRDRLMQVLINLLSNAVNVCRPGEGRVEIRLGVSQGFLQVDVRDNGPGISPADHEKVFEKFRQVGDTLTGKPRGTGLGLPISRRIIEHFGGRLWVESDLGAGATFSFTLPLERPAAGAAETVTQVAG